MTRKLTTWPLLTVAAAALVGSGALTMYLVMRRPAASGVGQPNAAAGAGLVSPPASAATETATSLPDVTIALSKEAVDRAGISVGRVGSSATGDRIRVPAVVQPNAYRTVVVTPIVNGRVTSVSAQLGQRVRGGQQLAQVYSPQLSEAQSRYVAARAGLEAHERELRRTEKLADIGSASRQELERIHAEHTAAVTMLESLRSQLTLFGITAGQIQQLTSSSEITATASVPAPIDGVITERAANVGLNVDTTTRLFTVVDLSTLWLVGNLYERDFGRVRVGSQAVITTPAYPALRLEGKVSYIEPAINTETRTAQLRVEVSNNEAMQLRLGMYADMEVGEATGGKAAVVPGDAVQVVGDRSVVYLADSSGPGLFIEREVRVGAAINDQVEIVSGVQPGDPLVVKGSFALRAERERLGLRPAGATGPPPRRDGQSSTRVIVSEKGFEPSRVTVRAGAPARITFVRTTDGTCATEIAIPSLEIRRALPLNQPVEIEFVPKTPGEIAFACGMAMFNGTVVVE
jgi:cobalt-zinc-cadmium efflux system membrane fusion protein